MGINFPNAPSEGQKFIQGTTLYTFANGLWAASKLATALPRNRVVNPSMQISQENGETPNNPNGYYAADQWFINYSGFQPSAFSRVSDVTGQTSNGKALLLQAVVARPSPAAGDVLCIIQNIEGVRVADFQWGAANAQQAVLRFTAVSTIAGIYSVAIRNAVVDRTFLAPFTLGPSTWHTITIVIPGDTTGTWLKDNGVGFSIGIGLGAGINYGGLAGWQAGNKIQIGGSTNWLATQPAYFYLGDVGLYLDSYQTGRAPLFEAVDDMTVMMESQRYWYKQTTLQGVSGAATAFSRAGHAHPAQMRAAPSVTKVGAPTAYDAGANSAFTINAAYANTSYCEMDSSTTGMTVGRGPIMIGTPAANHLVNSARM